MSAFGMCIPHTSADCTEPLSSPIFEKSMFSVRCVYPIFAFAVSFDRKGTKPSFLLSLFHLCLYYNLQFQKHNLDPILKRYVKFINN